MKCFDTPTEYEVINIGTRKQPMPMAFKKARKEGEMIALHPGSNVFVSKDDLVNIYTDKHSLYTARLTGLVFGEKVLEKSKMPEEKLTGSFPLETLSSETINSIIGIKVFNFKVDQFF